VRSPHEHEYYYRSWSSKLIRVRNVHPGCDRWCPRLSSASPLVYTASVRFGGSRSASDGLCAPYRLTLTCLAFNTAQAYRSRAGERLATIAIRRLRRAHQPALGAAPAVIYVASCYAVLALEELLAVLGAPVRDSLLPALPP
jgi:hypothetical protein